MLTNFKFALYFQEVSIELSPKMFRNYTETDYEGIWAVEMEQSLLQKIAVRSEVEQTRSIPPQYLRPPKTT
jgi:alanyl-tRNA synthetase